MTDLPAPGAPQIHSTGRTDDDMRWLDSCGEGVTQPHHNAAATPSRQGGGGVSRVAGGQAWLDDPPRSSQITDPPFHHVQNSATAFRSTCDRASLRSEAPAAPLCGERAQPATSTRRSRSPSCRPRSAEQRPGSCGERTTLGSTGASPKMWMAGRGPSSWFCSDRPMVLGPKDIRLDRASTSRGARPWRSPPRDGELRRASEWVAPRRLLERRGARPSGHAPV